MDKQEMTSCMHDEENVTPSAGDLYALLAMDQIDAEYDTQRLTYHELHRRTGGRVSEATIYRFFARQSKNPSAYNVLLILQAMGVSVDRILHIGKPETPTDPSEIHHMETEIEVLRYQVESKERHVQDLERQKAEADSLRDRYKEHFMHELETERQHHETEIRQERERCDAEILRREKMYENEKATIRRRATLRFVLAMVLAGISMLMFGLYLGADMLLSGDYALLRQLFQ